MFNSTGNNFGTGTIQFKDYQCDAFVILNSKFTIDTTDDAYQAAQQLEIYVPELSISRSVDVPVVARFTDRRTVSGETQNWDGGTVLHSQIANKNTLVIEKLPALEGKGVITIYIQAMYATLGQSSNSSMAEKLMVSIQQAEQVVWMTDTSFCVVYDGWAYLVMGFSNCQYAQRQTPWEGTLVNVPTDITADVAFIGGRNTYNPNFTGVSEAHIEGGVFTMPERMYNFTEGSPKPYIHAFLVRNNNN